MSIPSAVLRVVVFSYNRGRFLRNCMDSLERFAPWLPVTVFDDASDDAETLAVLDAIRGRHEVISSAEPGSNKHGGLYANMQRAFDDCGEELLCFLQDDTQLVRPVEAKDVAELQHAFTSREGLAFISPAFIRGIALRNSNDRDFRYDPGAGLWFWHPKVRRTGAHYSDICIAHRGRLNAVAWRFQTKESANDRQAAQHFGRMGIMRSPIAMWLPNVPAFRGKRRTLALRWAERLSRSGLYPLEMNSAASPAASQAGNSPPLPVAEDYLRPVGGELRRPWTYDPLQGRNLLRNLDRLLRR